MRAGDNSPWGRIQDVDVIAPGIEFCSTAGHGGIWLDAEKTAEVKRRFPHFRHFNDAAACWFEEDCDAAVVIVAFPQHFKSETVERAKARVLKDTYYKIASL